MIDLMGNKSKAKGNYEKAGVPVVPGSEGVISSISEAIKIVEKIGYPVILKSFSWWWRKRNKSSTY